MSTLTIKYLAQDIVEINLDGHRRTITRETAVKELALARLMVGDLVAGEAAQQQIRYYERAIGYMDAMKERAIIYLTHKGANGWKELALNAGKTYCTSSAIHTRTITKKSDKHVLMRRTI